MAWLPDGEKISKISLFVLTQLTNVIDTQTDRQTDRHRIRGVRRISVREGLDNRKFDESPKKFF